MKNTYTAANTTHTAVAQKNERMNGAGSSIAAKKQQATAPSETPAAPSFQPV